MKRLTVILIFLVTLKAFSQESSKLGMDSPELTFQNILNFDKKEAKLSDFKGKVVILDFWATWCAPCIKSFPQLEELQTNFAEELQIITITDDSEARIIRFLEKREMNLPIVIDEKRELAKIFPHRTIPHTIVIDKSGVIKAITTSSEINEDLIKMILNNEEISLAEKKDVMDFDPSKPLSENENFTYQVTITPFKDGYPSFSNTSGGKGPYTGRRIIATNLTARPLYEIAYQYPTGIRTIVEIEDKGKLEFKRQNAICLDIIVPEEIGDKRFEIMKQQLDIYFGYHSVIEERVRPVKILKPIDGAIIQLKEFPQDSETFASYGGRGLSMKSSPIGIVASFLESQFNVPVLEETNLKGLYDMELPWYNENPNQIHEELKQLGLEIVDAERKIKVLVIKDK
jgi:thiol-disulfide isomerase/thioredoxin